MDKERKSIFEHLSSEKLPEERTVRRNLDGSHRIIEYKDPDTQVINPQIFPD
jgi:hypothetical protein